MPGLGTVQRFMAVESLESRTLMSTIVQNNLVQSDQLPWRKGQTFVVDDFNSDVTKLDLGFNELSGNAGTVESQNNILSLALGRGRAGANDWSLNVGYDFKGKKAEAFAGPFQSLNGLTDTKISLDGSGREPAKSTAFPGYSLNFRSLYGADRLMPGRSADLLTFDIRATQGVTLKLELKDEAGDDVFTRRSVEAGKWQTVSLPLPTAFNRSTRGPAGVRAFGWTKVSLLSLIVERRHVADKVRNPDKGSFLLDNIRLVDRDGLYPDLDAARDRTTGGLKPRYAHAFLSYLDHLSLKQMLDLASTDPRTGGAALDRSTFADLISVGGTGFQLAAMPLMVKRDILTRAEAARRVHDILRALYRNPQGPGRVGTNGYKGWFYHFQGADGLRKQNFDFMATANIDESENTVELSVIDTALAVAGAITAGQYFSGSGAVETGIRTLAKKIYERVDWGFMLEPTTKQFYLGWKPNERRSGPPYNIVDASGAGAYSGTVGNPGTLDYYTDEGLLVSLLAIASPTHPVPVDVFFSSARAGDGFVKTFPGSLFTYFFGSVFLDTKTLGADADSKRSINYWSNTGKAIDATRAYAKSNPLGHATFAKGKGALRWGISAAEGPFDDYFADAAPSAALAMAGDPIYAKAINVEAEKGTGDGEIKSQTAAGGDHTVWLHDGETRKLRVTLPKAPAYLVTVRYSNDNFGDLETVTVTVDGKQIGSFRPADTGDWGEGWNVFKEASVAGAMMLSAGVHTIKLSVAGGDGNGVEIDRVRFVPLRPLEVGTATVYGAAGAIVHRPAEATAALWEAYKLGLIHPLKGAADAYNLNIADAAPYSAASAKSLRRSGTWKQQTAFAIDQGPMAILIDNYLDNQFTPRLFMSHPAVRQALQRIFPNAGLS